MIFVRWLAVAGFWLAFVLMALLYASAFVVAVLAGFLGRMAGYGMDRNGSKPT